MSQVQDSHDNNIRVSSRISLHGPVILLGGILLFPFVLIAVYIFCVYVYSHWQTFITQTSGYVSAVIWFIAAVGIVSLAYGSALVIRSGADALSKLGHVVIDIHRSFSEAKGQRERNKLLHAGENYVVHVHKGEVIVTPVQQQKVVNTYRHALLPETTRPEAHLPRLVRYSEIADDIPPGHSLVGIAEQGVVTRERESIRGLTAIFGGSNTGKSNTVTLRIHEDAERGHAILAIDPHLYKPDSLAAAISPYESHFLYPIAQHTDASVAICEQFLREWERRKAGGRYERPWTLVADEVSSMTNDMETEQEKLLARYLKSIARITGQEARGFDMCSILISQNASGLAWIRKNASMIIAHQVLAFSERLLVCNDDRSVARDMNTWPKGRTLIYGLGLEEGPAIYQQPLIRNVPRIPQHSSVSGMCEEWLADTDEIDIPEVPHMQERTEECEKIADEERERIINAARSGVKRGEMCKHFGRGKWYYDTVKTVLDEAGL